MESEVVIAQRSVLEELLTCPLCDNLFVNATTICECLHTFCRRCIYGKLTEEEGNCCPVCRTELGSIPVEKLRADHNLQELRSNVFTSDNEEVNALEGVPLVSMSLRKKERLLSSLGVSAPQVTSQPRLTGRRTKAVARHAGALRGSNFLHGEPFMIEDDSLDDHPSGSNSLESAKRTVHNRRQNVSTSEPSNRHIPYKHSEDGDNLRAVKVNGWEPLSCLAEAATSQDKSKFENADKSKFQDDSNNTNRGSSRLDSSKTINRMGWKKGVSLKDPDILAQAVLRATSVKRDRGPIWFTLVASQDQERYGSLPQITPRYLKIKNGCVAVSVIQKYLMVKLNLTTETEVEIMCHGQPIPSTLEINNLLNWWLQVASPPQRIQATVGSSGEQFVMVLQYRRNLRDL